MTPFLLAAALLLLVAAAFAAWPLLRSVAVPVAIDRQATNVSLYQQRRREIDADRRAGAISEEEAHRLTDELSAALLDDAVTEAPRVSAAGPSRRAALVVAIAVVAACVALYARLGAYQDVRLADAATLLTAAVAPPDALADLVKELRTHLASHPNDAESWYLLGHTLLRQHDSRGAVNAFERLVALASDDVGAQVALGQARFIADGDQLSATNRAAMQRVLTQDPQQSTALEMFALDAFKSGDYAGAARYLEKALAGGVSGARADSLKQGLARARALAGIDASAGPGFDVTVEFPPAARQLPPDAALFVFARQPGTRMPLLVARRSIQGATMTVRLDRNNAMQGDVDLHPGDVLDVAARVSLSGSIGGDPPALAAAQPGVELTDKVIAVKLALAVPDALPIAATNAAPPPPPAVPAPSGSKTVQIPIEVRLAAGVEASPPARIFVIARAPNGPPMPIAVRALDPASLPQKLELSDGDAMQPSRVLSMFDRVEVVARLSRSGNPIRQAGDLESPPQILDPHNPPPVALVIGPG